MEWENMKNTVHLFHVISVKSVDVLWKKVDGDCLLLQMLQMEIY